MDRRRLDLLPECNGNAAPLDVFTRECCANCFNPECTRSLSGTLKFDQRVANWHQRLFAAVNRMDANDPRYPKISGQKFLTLDTSRMPEISTSAWVDPRDLTEGGLPTTALVSAPAAVKTGEVVLPTATVESSPAPTRPEPRPPTTKRQVPTQLLLSNTPAKAGVMIKPSEAPLPAKDSWAAPVPPPPSDIPMVQPGSKVKLGGSGV